MGIIELYVLFCLTTAIVGMIQIYYPMHKKLKENHINNTVTKAPILGNIIFFIVGLISAPVLFIILIIPSTTQVFIDAMYGSIIEVK